MASPDVHGYVAEDASGPFGWMRTLWDPATRRCSMTFTLRAPTCSTAAGPAARLLEVAEHCARGYGVSELWVGVMEQNLRALEWYKRRGFTSGTRPPSRWGRRLSATACAQSRLRRKDRSMSAESGLTESLGLGPVALLRPGNPLCGGDDGLGYHVQTPRYLQYRYRALHKLALPSLGDQAALESVCGHVSDQAIWVVTLQFVIGVALAGVALTIPLPIVLPVYNRHPLAHGLFLGNARYRSRRPLHARAQGASAGSVRGSPEYVLSDFHGDRAGTVWSLLPESSSGRPAGISAWPG